MVLYTEFAARLPRLDLADLILPAETIHILRVQYIDALFNGTGNPESAITRARPYGFDRPQGRVRKPDDR